MLRDPAAFRHLGEAAVARMREEYAIDVMLPRLARLFEQTVERGLDDHVKLDAAMLLPTIVVGR